MKWEMGVENMESVLEKIWDLHDKLSDAIHSISRTHFLNSIRSHTSRTANDEISGFPKRKPSDSPVGDGTENNNRAGFVYFKDFSGDVDADGSEAVQEAKSLNAIRTALENLEDQLEFFHTVQTQQQAERDSAISRIEQSRIILAMRLAEHQGKKYDVIKEARAFVGNVCHATHFVSQAASPISENFESEDRKRRNAILNAFQSRFNHIKRTLKLDCMGGVLGNAAMVAISMFALMHFHQVGIKNRYTLEVSESRHEDSIHKNITRVSQLESSSSSGGRSTPLDVLLARG